MFDYVTCTNIYGKIFYNISKFVYNDNYDSKKNFMEFYYRNTIRTEMLRKHVQDTEKELCSIIIWRGNMLDE